MKKTHRALLVVIIAVMATVVLLVGWGLYPKSMPHPVNTEYATAYYRGFGVPGAPGLLGRLWGRVEMSEIDGGTWVFEYEHEGYNNFRRYYANGDIREEGECWVEIMGFQSQPFPDDTNLRSCKCYRPDGTLGSEVRNGTGTETGWTAEGVKIWEGVLKDYVRQKHSIWFPNGQLRQTQDYAEGNVHGPFKSYYQDGSVETVGAYSFGERIGTWERYHEDGTLKSVERYGDGKLRSEQDSP